MPALKSLPNLRKVAANRLNAQKSTGPTTEAGKARSRGNATAHGLAGAGIALPTEDATAVAERFAALRDQLQPTTLLGAYYVGRIALGTVRAERAARHEAAALAHRVRHAISEFAIARAVAHDEALVRLRGGDGLAARRDLMRSPDGIDRLIAELSGLRRCLEIPQTLWTRDYGRRLDACLGVIADALVPTRVETLTEALLGTEDLLTRSDLATIAEAKVAVPTYALHHLARLIDQEIAALRADQVAFDPAEHADDEAAAVDRSLFDPSPAAQLARRYEAAAAREVDRALRQFHVVETGTKAATEATNLPAVSNEGGQDNSPNDHPAPVLAADDQASRPADLCPAESTPAERIQKAETIAPNMESENDLTAPVASIGRTGRAAAKGKATRTKANAAGSESWGNDRDNDGRPADPDSVTIEPRGSDRA